MPAPALALASLSPGPDIDLWWRRLAKKLGSHAGRRKQNKTTDATMRETPIRTMAEEVSRRTDGDPSVAGAWEYQVVDRQFDSGGFFSLATGRRIRRVGG